MKDSIIPTHSSVRFPLNAGVLNVEITRNLLDSTLFKVAERINPKRAFLFVSTVLGRHIPVRPRDHMAAAASLGLMASEFVGDGPVLAIGYAETAVGLGAAVAREISLNPDVQGGVRYMSTTRHPVEAREWLFFEEGHSHATDQLLMRPDGLLQAEEDASATLVLIDDEATTGKTFAELVIALRGAGFVFERIVLATLTDWSMTGAQKAVSQASPASVVSCVSLMAGGWSWRDNGDASRASIPQWEGQKSPVWEPADSQNTMHCAPRTGLDPRHGSDLDGLITAGLEVGDLGDERILVIGTGEHVWGPMLLAEQIERRGGDVHFIATTRSPILSGDVIRRKAVFADHFGLGVPMYLHNVAPEDWDHIILMTETGSEGISNDLRAYLGQGQIINGNGKISMMERGT